MRVGMDHGGLDEGLELSWRGDLARMLGYREAMRVALVWPGRLNNRVGGG